MRIDIGLILAVILEYIVFIYYSNTLFYRKKSRLFCGIVITSGYAIHFFICMFGNVAINTITFALVNILAFSICFYTSKSTAIFQGIILTVLSTAGEFIIASVKYLGIELDSVAEISSVQSLILTFLGKLIYIIGIMILTNLFKKKDNNSVNVYSFLLMPIPILTLIVLLFMIQTPVSNHLQAIICASCIIIDLIVLIINQKFAALQLETEALRIQTKKDKLDFETYMELKHLNHDMNEHLNVLNSLVDDNNEQAKKYICSLNEEKERVLNNIVNYTDNSIINIVLSRKMAECKEQNIAFTLDPVQASLNFFSDMDAVTVFANLINNAIEGCFDSDKKWIYMRIYTVNNNFIVIKLTNSSANKPLVIDGKLKTHKDNEQLHGIGISNIKQSLKKYNGNLSWSYDNEKKEFCSMIVIQRGIGYEELNIKTDSK